MNTLVSQKKAAPEDWHRADIVAAVRKKGLSLRAIAVHEGLSPGALSNALDRPWPKGERLIAAAIGVDPELIWPTRYEKRNFKPAYPSMTSNKVAMG